MNITITFRHMVGTEAVKRHAHEKVAKLQKFLRQAMSAQVTLSVLRLPVAPRARSALGPSPGRRGQEGWLIPDEHHDHVPAHGGD